MESHRPTGLKQQMKIIFKTLFEDQKEISCSLSEYATDPPILIHKVTAIRQLKNSRSS